MFNIKINSNKVKKGDTFVAIKGHTVDGHDYIENAIKNGAEKIIAESGNYSKETIIVSNPTEYITKYILENYKEMINDINFIGLTGTNGKTTTCYLTYQMLNKLGIKTAYIGTIGFYMDDYFEEISNTTPNIVDLYELITKAYEHGCKHIVMEVSSHALALDRIAGIKYDVAGFTNLTQDHLDYHKDMENYLKTKQKLCNISKKIVVNNDDPYAKHFCSIENKKIGTKTSDDFAINKYEDNELGTLINFTYKNKTYDVQSRLRGKFNIYNFLMMVGIVSNYQELLDVLEECINVYAPKGRCEIIQAKDGEVIVDYAHTPDAVLKVIEAFKETSKGRIITLVGCGGDRDPVKRPIMGKIASDNSDYVIFTSDNPRTEDPKLIMEDVVREVNKENFEIILNRKEAIKRAIDKIEKNDTVLLLGKGHEDYQIIGHEKIHLDDAEEVKKYIEELKNC